MAETLFGFISTKLRGLRRTTPVNTVEEIDISPEEEAKRFGQRFNTVWGGSPDETPVSEFTSVLRLTRSELLKATISGEVSPLVGFVSSITQKEKNLISSSLFPIQRVLMDDGKKNPTLGDLRTQVQKLNSEFTSGVPASASTVNFGVRRMAFISSGFQKLQ